MKVQDIYSFDKEFLDTLYYACPVVAYDPMEIAIKKYCEELNICSFIKAKANKKDCQANSKIEYRKNYLRIKLTHTKEKEGGPQNENN